MFMVVYRGIQDRGILKEPTFPHGEERLGLRKEPLRGISVRNRTSRN
jgi:hypothetical protein